MPLLLHRRSPTIGNMRCGVVVLERNDPDRQRLAGTHEAAFGAVPRGVKAGNDAIDRRLHTSARRLEAIHSRMPIRRSRRRLSRREPLPEPVQICREVRGRRGGRFFRRAVGSGRRCGRFFRWAGRSGRPANTGIRAWSQQVDRDDAGDRDDRDHGGKAQRGRHWDGPPRDPEMPFLWGRSDGEQDGLDGVWRRAIGSRLEPFRGGVLECPFVAHASRPSLNSDGARAASNAARSALVA